MKKLEKPNVISKVDLTTKKEEPNAIQEQNTNESMLGSQGSEMGLQEVVEGNAKHEPVAVEESKEEVVVMHEVTNEEVAAASKVLTTEVEEAIQTAQSTGKALPENVEKLVSFMEETGGTVEDYVRLNADYTSINSEALLKEYYKN